MNTPAVARAVQIREFNRFYTNIIGLVNRTYLSSPYSLAEVRLLLEIQLAGECTAADLTRLLVIDPGYLSRILRRFSKEELIAKAPSSTDGRALTLALTAKGRELIARLSAESTDEIVRLLERLPDSAQEGLVSHMQAIQATLSAARNPFVTIRPHQPGDLGYIAYQHSVLYEKEYALDHSFEEYVITGMANYIADGADGEIWVAESSGRIVGSIAIVSAGENAAQLRWFLIEPEYRGTGLGRQLMSAAMDYCRGRRFQRVFLWTFRGLDAARHLYRSFGFLPTESADSTAWGRTLTEERWEATLE